MKQYEVKVLGSRIMPIEATVLITATCEVEAKIEAMGLLLHNNDPVDIEELGHGVDNWHWATEVYES